MTNVIAPKHALLVADEVAYKLDAQRTRKGSLRTDDGLLGYMTDILDALEIALHRRDLQVADRLAALYCGCERRADVRAAAGRMSAAFAALNTRWRSARARCSFPTDRTIATVMDELCPLGREKTEAA